MAGLRKLVKTWKEAKADPEKGELTSGFHGSYERHFVEHGWWLTPEQWGIGVAVERADWLPSGYDGKLLVTVQIGPFTWSLVLSQPLRSSVKAPTR